MFKLFPQVDELQNAIEEEQRSLVEELRNAVDDHNKNGVENGSGGPEAMAVDQQVSTPRFHNYKFALSASYDCSICHKRWLMLVEFTFTFISM